MRNRSFVIFLLCALLPKPGWGKVFLQWSEPNIPSPAALGVGDLVVLWNQIQGPFPESARRQGFRVYVEVPSQQISAAADTSAAKGFAGVIVKLKESDLDRNELDDQIRKLRSTYPKLAILLLPPGGKQPQMRGNLIMKRDGVLEVSSPTIQPWIDSNLALARFERAIHSSQRPLIGFSWDLTDSLERLEGPRAEDYALAVAEAGTFHADLILDVHEKLQKAIVRGLADAWAVWNQVKRYIQFFSHESDRSQEFIANVGVIADNYEGSQEVTNLMARHNIPFHVARLEDLKAQRFTGLDLIVVFTSLDDQATRAVVAFAEKGGIAILMNLHGSYPWQLTLPSKTSEHSTSYTVGKGKVLELSEPAADPETFAQDIRRLLDKQKTLISLWNALTTLAVACQRLGSSNVALEMVNYAEDPLQVQVRIKGSFSHIRYETPERGCCVSLSPVHRNGFTEFVVPWLRIGGRAHLGSAERKEP